MKCPFCNYENNETDQLCSNCRKPLTIEPIPIQTVIPRQLPPDNNTPAAAYHVCSNCGKIFADTLVYCNQCGWDIRNAIKKPSRFSFKGCLTTLIMRILGMGVSSAISFGVGMVSVYLGFEDLMAKFFTTIASTILSFIPIMFRWIINSVKARKTKMVSIIVLVFLTSSLIQPVKAQTLTPADILQSLLEQVNATAVDWSHDPEYPDSTVYFKSSDYADGYTNAAQVVNLGETIGSTGGQLWLDTYLEILENPEKECSVQPYSLYDSRAYFYECTPGDSYQSGIIWEQGEWAAAAYNFVYPVGDYSVEYLAENLYALIPADGGGVIQPTEAPASIPTGEWTQDDINRMAIQVLDGYAEAKGWPEGISCTTFTGCFTQEEPGVLVYEERNDELVEKGLIEDPSLQTLVQSGLASYYMRGHQIKYAESNEYNNISILYLPDQQALDDRLNVIFNKTNRDPGLNAYVSPKTIILENSKVLFHGQNGILNRLALETTNPGEETRIVDRFEVFAWVQYPWFFTISGKFPIQAGSTTLDYPLFDPTSDPELLYLLASQAGMFNPPTTTAPNASDPIEATEQLSISAPTPQPQFSEEEVAGMNEDDLSALALMLTPSALLPALGVAGLSLLIDLLRRRTAPPPGMINSPIPGIGPVHPDVAANQLSLLKQGYTFDRNTGKFLAPRFASPFDGRLLLRHELDREIDLRNKGFILNGESFVQQADLDIRERKWREGQEESFRNGQKSINEAREKRELIAGLRQNLNQLEAQSDRDYRDSQILQQDTIGTIWKASQMTARTVVTGIDQDGNLSFSAMGARMLAAGITAGTSEIVMNSADFGYRVHDGVQSGMTFAGAAAVSLAWMGVEAGALKVGGKAIRWAAGTTPVAALANQIRNGAGTLLNSLNPYKTTVLDPALESTKNALKNALRGGQLGEISEDQVRALYRSNGRKVLCELESKGLINPSEARAISKLITQDVNAAVTHATPNAIRNFENQTGIKIKSVLVADSGSSSGRSFATRSVNSDFDRSILLEVDNDSLNAYAKNLMENNSALTQSQAREMAQIELQSQFSSLHQNQMDQQLSRIGLNTKDLDYKNYSGLSGDPKMGDSYPAGYNRARMSNQGEAFVFRQNTSGEIVTSKMTGQQVVDQEALSKINLTGSQGQQAADIINNQQPIISSGDALKVLAQQNEVALSSTDPLKLAKALLRADKAQRILAGIPGIQVNGPPKIPESILHIAEDLIKNPQQSADKIPPGFLRAASEQIKNLFSVVNQ